MKLSIAALNPMVVLSLLFVLDAPFAGYREHVLVEVYLHVLAVDLRQLDLDQEGILIFVDVHGRRPGLERDIFARRAVALVKELMNSALQFKQLTKRIRTKP